MSNEHPTALMPTVSLCAHEGNFLGLIVPAHIGTYWTNQTGGTACMQPRVEGLFIPLVHAWLPDPLQDFVRDYEQDLIDGFLAASPELGALFESDTANALSSIIWEHIPQRIDHNGQRVVLREDRLQLMEAWVPVRIRSERPTNPGITCPHCN